jgi:hypothetical protein
MYQLRQELSDGTYISLTAPGRRLAYAAFDYLRTLTRATNPEVSEVKPPELKLIGRL